MCLCIKDTKNQNYTEAPSDPTEKRILFLKNADKGQGNPCALLLEM